MDRNTGRRTKLGAANFFGALGYFFGFLQWFWAVMLYFSVIQSATLFLSPGADQSVKPSPIPAITIPSSVEVIILIVTVVLMVAVTVYALVKIPVSIVKNSNKVVHKAAEVIAPAIIKAEHKKDTKKFRVKLTTRLVLIFKLVLIVLPLALTAASGWLEKQSVDYGIALIIACGLASLAVIFFALQYAIAGIFRVTPRSLW